MKYSNKLKDLNSLKKITQKLNKERKKVVFTNGCFDIIHPGHIKLLKEAKKRGNILITAINSDKSIQKIKGNRRPVFNDKARAEIISSLDFVDYVIIFDEPTPYKLIKQLKPDILVKGGDWKKQKIVGKNIVDKIVRVKPLRGYSTTATIEKIIKLYKGGAKKNIKSN